jgi:hypothetical protein
MLLSRLDPISPYVTVAIKEISRITNFDERHAVDGQCIYTRLILPLILPLLQMTNNRHGVVSHIVGRVPV